MWPHFGWLPQQHSNRTAMIVIVFCLLVVLSPLFGSDPVSYGGLSSYSSHRTDIEMLLLVFDRNVTVEIKKQ